MVDADRTKILQQLDLRHDEVLRELAELTERIESVLASLRPAAIEPASAAKVRKGVAAR